MNLEEAVGAELRACRRRKQISQEQLGFDAGVHRTYVSLIERGVKSPTLGVLFRLCRRADMRTTKIEVPTCDPDCELLHDQTNRCALTLRETHEL